MSTKLESAAKKAATPVTPVIPATSSHKASGLMATIRKQAETVASLTITTVAFLLMAAVTLGADAFVHQYLFVWFHTEPESLLAKLFTGAKYVAVIIELAFWLYGIYQECRHHAED